MPGSRREGEGIGNKERRKEEGELGGKQKLGARVTGMYRPQLDAPATSAGAAEGRNW